MIEKSIRGGAEPPKSEEIISLIQIGAKQSSFWFRVSKKTKFILPILVVFLPKCPLCIISYSSVLSLFGIDIFRFRYSPSVLMFLLLSILLISLGLRSLRLKFFPPFVLGLIGALIMTISYLNRHSGAFYKSGIGILLVATILGALWDSKVLSSIRVFNRSRIIRKL